MLCSQISGLVLSDRAPHACRSASAGKFSWSVSTSVSQRSPPPHSSESQALERVASFFYGAIEGFEKNVLGWDIPGDDDMIPMYQNLALYYPEEHAYTFDAYR